MAGTPPLFSGVEDGEFTLILTSWSKHLSRKDRQCTWRRAKPEEDRIRFEWNNSGKLRYCSEEEFSGQGTYVINCEGPHQSHCYKLLNCRFDSAGQTHNILSLPTKKERTTFISMRGMTRLALSFDEKISWRYLLHFVSLTLHKHLTFRLFPLLFLFLPF